MADEEAVCLWTDPPYGVEYEGGTKNKLTLRNDSAEGLSRLLEESFAAMDAVLASGAAVYVAHPAGALSVTFSSRFLARGWRLHQTLVWGEEPVRHRALGLPLPPRVRPRDLVGDRPRLRGPDIRADRRRDPVRYDGGPAPGPWRRTCVASSSGLACSPSWASSGSSSLQPNAPGVFLIGATASIAEELPFGLN